MNDIIIIIAKAYVILFTLQSLLWLRQVYTKNATSADIGWSIGMAFIVCFYALNFDGYWLRELIVCGLIVIWSLRLSTYLFNRAVIEKKEDSRYARFRAQWGERSDRNFFLIYQLQPIFNVILSIPFLILLKNSTPVISGIEIFGIAIWITGFVGESIADRQLHDFKQRVENKGKICQEGLWNYSRHPNFFFEWTMWVGYFVIGLGSPYGILGIIAPLFMLFLLMKVTGIPVIEKYALEKKGEAFRNYMRTTSFFVPLPKRV